MDDFIVFSNKHRSSLETALVNNITHLCDVVLAEPDGTNTLWQTVLQRELIDYASRGKMIRGLLTAYWAYLCGHTVKKNDTVFDAASVMELLQAFLLIHDDIMDNDDTRRSKPSMHVRLGRIASEFHGVSVHGDAISRMGEALAICVGDMVFAHAVTVLNTSMPPSSAGKSMEVFGMLVSKVGMAQMNDMYWEWDRGDGDTSSENGPSKNTILSMYEGKTGHYTFALPSILGYLYAVGSMNKPHSDEQIAALTRMGGLLGKIFQIDDDILDVRYDSSVTGKPRGSDIVKKKQTFFKHVLFLSAPDENALQILRALWNGEIRDEHVQIICGMADGWGVWNIIEAERAAIVQQLYEVLNAVQLSDPAREALNSFVNYILQRKL